MADKDQEAPKKKSKLKWIILIILLLLLGGAGAGAWFLFGDKLFGVGDGAEGDEAKKAETKTVQVQSTPQSGTVFALPQFLVNLSDPLGRRYIKVTFEVELTDEAAAASIQQQMPKVRDSIIVLLSSKTYSDLASPESKYLLKTEVADRLNQILGGSKVMQVYITDMVIQ